MQIVMSNARTSPRFISLHRLCTLSGRSRGAVLLRMTNGQITVDATLDIGDRELPMFLPGRVEELKRLPLRKPASPIL